MTSPSPASTRLPPYQTTATVAKALAHSMTGISPEESVLALTFAWRLSSLRRSNWSSLTSSRENAWTTLTPSTFSWKPAATAPTVWRVRR